ncbi:MAG: UDP-N-acetylmuramoyl-tripeptide--D-alanyl-D-alanine ligase [Lachnospiraceae bacterium]|nr:UDP-N-acetylmuramoyl-tripeptide--D-alanyl-D-alanine ligase [Lachnospiraceae bacterium]
MRLTAQEIAARTGGTVIAGDPQTVIGSIVLDSRAGKGDSLFIPIHGERVDGHDYIAGAFAAGCTASLTDRGDIVSGGTLIRVADTVKALQDIGRAARREKHLPVVGVTGSVGKTSTREMVACVLRAKYRTFSTSGNHNGQLGLPIMLFDIAPEDEIAVLEMGMSMPGEMSVLADMARVDAAVFTNVGVSHIENLGSQENICREKLHILDGSPETAPLIYNADDPILAKFAPETGRRTVGYGIDAGDVRAQGICSEGLGTSFTLVWDGGKTPVHLSVPGTHNVMNALAAVCAGMEFGISPEEAAEALSGHRGFARRLEISSWNGRTLIDDSYNASPASMKAALEVLSKMEPEGGGRRIAVLANMLELGPNEKEYHREVGRYLETLPVADVILIGDLAAEMAGELTGPRVHLSENGDPAAALLREISRPGDIVLFKGSNGMHLDRVIGAWKKNEE